MKYNGQRKNRNRAIVGLIACSGLALGGIMVHDLGSQTAMAADNKVISGHACAPEDDYDDTDRSDPRWLESLKDDQTYMCPVVRDDIKGQLDDVWIRLRNDSGGSGSEPLECTVHSVSVGASFQDSESKSTSSSGFQTLAFKLSSFTEYDNGHYVIECELEDGDRIISYRAREN